MKASKVNSSIGSLISRNRSLLLIWFESTMPAQAKQESKKQNKKGYWSSLRPVPFLNVLCPMAYSSLALSVWSSSFHLFSFCTDCTAMFMAEYSATWVSTLYGSFLLSYLIILKMFPLRTYPLIIESDLLFDRCDDLKYGIWSGYFSSCTFPVSDQF